MTSTTPSKPTSKPTSQEVLDSLTGFEEIAIEKAFGDDISRLARVSVGKFGRGLAFVLAKRDGKSDADARKHALELTRTELNDLFAPDEDDSLPGSESGKDES